MSVTHQSRDYTIDALRCLAMLCVIVAHCMPPDWLFQLRNFDVPLLVVVSGLTYAMFPRSKIMPIKDFLVKRLARLIIPAWIFLTFFFALIFVAAYFGGAVFPFSGKEIVTSYAFYSGIGYVWILRVFAMIAILTPFLLHFRDRVQNNAQYFGIIVFLYALYELAVAVSGAVITHPKILEIFQTVILIIIPYAALYAYGLKLRSFSAKTVVSIMLLAACVFCAMAIWLNLRTGSFVPTQDYKYPPRLYYLSYGLAMINVAYLTAKRWQFRGRARSAIVWVSENSLWLYLWHIFALYAFECGAKTLGFYGLWYLKFFVVLSVASFITQIQKIILTLILKQIRSARSKKWLRIAFE